MVMCKNMTIFYCFVRVDLWWGIVVCKRRIMYIMYTLRYKNKIFLYSHARQFKHRCACFHWRTCIHNIRYGALAVVCDAMRINMFSRFVCPERYTFAIFLFCTKYFSTKTFLAQAWFLPGFCGFLNFFFGVVPIFIFSILFLLIIIIYLFIYLFININKK